jgi:hypothetical protein
MKPSTAATRITVTTLALVVKSRKFTFTGLKFAAAKITKIRTATAIAISFALGPLRSPPGLPSVGPSGSPSCILI